jgi:hypothetical protein
VFPPAYFYAALANAQAIDQERVLPCIAFFNDRLSKLLFVSRFLTSGLAAKVLLQCNKNDWYVRWQIFDIIRLLFARKKPVFHRTV